MNKDKRGLVDIPLKELTYAFLAAGFLVVILVVVGNASNLVFASEHKAQAEGMLDRFSFFISDLKDNQPDKFLFYEPKNFFIVNGKGLTTIKDKSLCADSECICICKEEDCSGKEAYCRKTSVPITFSSQIAQTNAIQIGFTELSIMKAKGASTIQGIDMIREPGTTSTAMVNPNVDVKKPGFLPAKHRPVGTQISLIVLHHTAGTSWTGAYEEFLKDPSQKSIHYILEKDGTIYYTVDESLQAEHAGDNGGFNSKSIGIEIVNTGSEPFTDKQYSSLNALLTDITRRYDLPYDNNHIIAHYQTAQGVRDNKPDPSTYFDWARIGLPDHPLKSQRTGPIAIA